MPSNEQQSEPTSPRFPWYFIWVLGGIFFAGVAINDFRVNGKFSALVVASGWICMAFSWYAKPFSINPRAGFSKAATFQPLRPWVSQSVWNFITLGALALMVGGAVLKYGFAV